MLLRGALPARLLDRPPAVPPQRLLAHVAAQHPDQVAAKAWQAVEALDTGRGALPRPRSALGAGALGRRQPLAASSHRA